MKLQNFIVHYTHPKTFLINVMMHTYIILILQKLSMMIKNYSMTLFQLMKLKVQLKI